MAQYLAKYATRNTQGKEVHKQFKVKAHGGLKDARARAAYQLHQHKGFTPGRDYVYNVIEVRSFQGYCLNKRAGEVVRFAKTFKPQNRWDMATVQDAKEMVQQRKGDWTLAFVSSDIEADDIFTEWMDPATGQTAEPHEL